MRIGSSPIPPGRASKPSAASATRSAPGSRRCSPSSPPGRRPSERGRLGTPADIGSYVTFLVSPAGHWISGQLLHADGGISARY
ncbi:SDR family oxidoreductase [Mycetocola saprophilus]|uniref:SDR family oxidoreductase n=1 Tax=Mycetocola saprophilus TaxID=76636 RepID=UPI0012DFBC29